MKCWRSDVFGKLEVKVVVFPTHFNLNNSLLKLRQISLLFIFIPALVLLLKRCKDFVLRISFHWDAPYNWSYASGRHILVSLDTILRGVVKVKGRNAGWIVLVTGWDIQVPVQFVSPYMTWIPFSNFMVTIHWPPSNTLLISCEVLKQADAEPRKS